MATGLPLVAGLLGGCRAGCEVQAAAVEPEPGLDGGVDYLASLRSAAEAADPSARAQWERDGREYADFKPVRLAELKSHPYLLQFPGFTDEERLGWDAWFHWTAGNQFTWRDLAQRSRGKLELLKILDNDRLDREERFARFGLINDPDALPPERDENGRCRVDAFGLCLDRFESRRESPRTARWLGRPSGILGMRLFDNPNYRPGAWNAADPWNPPPGCKPGAREGNDPDDPARTARQSNEDCYQPPYLVGLSCGFCHISFNPEKPPADANRPGWENLAGLLGNVYFQEGPLFAWMLDFGKDAFYTEYLNAQPPGTSDTSRIATDDLDNPGAINALFQVRARLAETAGEEMPNGRRQPVPRILKDGADSVGLPLAALRVFVNIGMLGNYWLNQHDAYLLLGGEPRPQRPFRIERAMRTPGYDGTWWWNQTELRVADVAAFFAASEPYKLASAPGGAAHLTADAAVLRRGKLVFADHCAGCHSSKRPAADAGQDGQEQMRELVLRPDFLDGNLLADDRRHAAPVVGVNLTRAMATNALAGHVWQDFSSLTYKNQPPLGKLALADPFKEGESREFCAPAGGRGYYRTASLVSLWATAPFFHNNSLGRHLQDASVAGRVRAFEDAAEQLLWPEKRTDPQGRVGPYVKRTGDGVTWLPLGDDGLLVPLPPRYPIKVLGNLPLHRLAEKLSSGLAGALLRDRGAQSAARKERILREVLGNEALRLQLRKLLLDLNAAPDFVENKGHESIVARIQNDEDKRALIEFMKTF